MRAHRSGTLVAGAVLSLAAPRSTCGPCPSLSLTRRHKSVWQSVHRLTEMKLSNAYEKEGKHYTSKNVGTGPQYGAGFDPVLSDFAMKNMTGPLKRKQNTTPEDYLNVDESEKWMDAKQAAKILGIKEAELPVLTRAVLEEKWAKAYRETSMAKQQEVLIATEVLLEYLDSTLAVKKSRQYYRNFLDNARASIDFEIMESRREQRQKMIWLFGFAMFGTCVAVLFVAYSRKYISRDDVGNIGIKAKEYMIMTFVQPNNLEPPPDYNTRYHNTPTSMDIDKQSGMYDMQFMSSEERRMIQLKDEYDRREEAEIIKMLNDENDRAAKQAKEDSVRSSRVMVYLPEELDAHGQLTPEAKAARDAANGEQQTEFEKMNFRQFAGMMARNFGGGSRFQRLTEETTARSEGQREIETRLTGRS